jgi:light-regulated signal transduction histidine kinase (bacteriophytochrome)
MLTGSEATTAPATAVDTSNCDREPIHIPGSIQPHGVLMVLAEDTSAIRQISENSAEWLGVSHEQALEIPVEWLLGEELVRGLASRLASARTHVQPQLLSTWKHRSGGKERSFNVVVHRNEAGIILELETIPEPSSVDIRNLLDGFMMSAEQVTSMDELSRMIAVETRRLTGFDRVLVYRFDEGWNGTVIGEDGNGRLPSLLDHRFPASDIPAQARELYRLNRIRCIPDASYRPVPLAPPISPVTKRPLDMSFSTLRSVSPVHLEYMKNMDTAAATSISILREGKLWGLISCHNREPRTVPFPVQVVCDLFARAFSLRLSALEHARDYERRMEQRVAYAKLLGVMTDRGDFASALAENAQDLIAFTNASGAAILTDGTCLLMGETPTEHQVRALANWLFQEVGEEVYSTESLSGTYPPAHSYKDKASGLLAAAISKLHPSYVLWFRPEVIRTIKWGGDPNKPISTNGDATKLHPRKSFETWMETVRDRSLPWKSSEIEGAGELRNTIVGTVLRRAEELASLNDELTRSNKELEAFSYSVSHDLRAPLRHIVGYAELLREGASGRLSEREERFIHTIIESSEYAGRLVDKLLGFSRLGRAELQLVRVDMNVLVREIQQDVMRDAASRRVTWRVGGLPTVNIDLMMIRMAVRDLLSNAIKYTRNREEAVIEVDCHDEGNEYVFSVKDNGVGFDMEYVDKLFGVFQRLHRWEDYEGTGIGLANVRRVVERHGGRTWAQGEEGQGATFFFSLPKPLPEE